jgi:hypothetical protein
MVGRAIAVVVALRLSAPNAGVIEPAVIKTATPLPRGKDGPAIHEPVSPLLF